MDDKLIDELFEHYEKNYGFEINDANDLFEAEKNLLEFVMKAGRNLEKKFFDKVGTGYEGKTIKKRDYIKKSNGLQMFGQTWSQTKLSKQ